MLSHGRASIGGRSSIALAAAKKREAFSFPVLSADEIRACLREMGMAPPAPPPGAADGDDELLGRAKPELVRNVYDQLIYECTGASPDTLYAPRPCVAGAGAGAGTTLPRYGELHEDSIPVLHFMRALNKLLVASGVGEGYTLRELIKPDATRLRRNLSAIINFQKFREEKIEQWAEHGRRTVELEHTKAMLEAERRDAETQLQREKNLRAMEQPAISELQRAVSELESAKAELQATASKLSSRIEEQKRTIAELKDGATTMDSKAEGLREELEAARQQVVSSPARLKSDVEHMTRLVEDAQVGAAAAAAEAASLQCRSEVVAKATKDVRKTLLLLGELETEVLRLKRVHKEAKARAAAKEEKAAEVADLQSQVERMERRVKAAEEKLAEQKHSAYVKQEATQRANQALREELQNSQNELDRARGSQKEAANRMGTIKTEHDRIQAAHNAEMAEMVSAMRSIQKSVSDYHGRLFADMAKVGGSLGAADHGF